MSEVVMPRLSDTMEEGELTRWLKNVGDAVHRGDVLAEIETDKATMDLESFEDGILEQQLVTEGTLVPIGQPLAIIGDGSGTVAAVEPAVASSVAEPVDAPSVAAPLDAPSVAAPPVAERVEAPSPLTSSGSPVAQPIEERLRTSPLARLVAREHDIELRTLSGTGPQGRILRADVDAEIARRSQATPVAPPQPAALAPGPVAAVADGDEEIPLNNIRRVTARRLTESQAVPHFFLTGVVDAEKLIAFRAEVNASLDAKGIKVSLNDVLVAGAAIALREHPDANSSWSGDRLLRHGHVNIGIAVATEAGLVVPVVTDADRRSLTEIARTTAELAAKARDGKLALADMSGGTFTISNLGMFGVDQFTAVLNPPEAAILAVGAAAPVPVLRDGELVDVPKMKITLTADHRVLDGAVAAAFLRTLTRILEQPLRILL
jgi:pyruvate dehydrogenase E2 component (dihydrolipoamide acetyltransferase)